MAIGAPNVGTATARTAETSTAVPYPATVNAKDFLILFGSVSNSALTADIASWTTIKSASATGNTANPNIFMAYKTGGAVGNEGGTNLTVPHNNNVSGWQILGFSGVDLVSPFDVALGTAGLFIDTTGDITFGSVTVNSNGVTAVVGGAVAGASSTVTPPAGYTESMDITTAGGTRSGELAYKQGINAGASGTALMDFSGTGASLGQQVFLKAAVAAAISSANNVTFQQGAAGTFTVTTTGTGPMSIAKGGVALPTGVTFVDNGNGTGTLAGTPGAGSFAGSPYAITFTPTGQLGAGSAQSFTLTVSAPAASFDATKSEELFHALQRVSGTTLDVDGAANAWAGTTGKALLGALNAKAGTTGLDMMGVLNKLATGNATSGYGVNTCAANLV